MAPNPFLNVWIIIISDVRLPPAEVTYTKFEFALGIWHFHCGGSICPLSSDRRFIETAWQVRRGGPPLSVVPSALSDMGSTARDQERLCALCTPSPQQLQRSTVLATAPNDLEWGLITPIYQKYCNRISSLWLKRSVYAAIKITMREYFRIV